MRRRGSQGARLDIRPVLEYYGAQSKTGTSVPPNRFGWQAMRCPFHDDRHASARVTLEDGGAFKCHGCDAQGDAISLIIQRGDASDFASALEFYEGVIGGSVPEVRRGNARQPRRGLFEEQGPRSYERGSSLFSTRARRKPGGGT